MKQGGVSTGKKNHFVEGYANRFRVGFDAFKILIEFGLYSPVRGKTHYSTRIVMSPSNAKALLEILVESLDQHEQSYGVIAEGQNNQHNSTDKQTPNH